MAAGLGIGEGAARIGSRTRAVGASGRSRQPGAQRRCALRSGIASRAGSHCRDCSRQRRQCIGRRPGHGLEGAGAFEFLAESGEGVGHGLGRERQVGRIDQAGLPDHLDLQSGIAQRLHHVLLLGRGDILADQPVGAELAHQFGQQQSRTTLQLDQIAAQRLQPWLQVIKRLRQEGAPVRPHAREAPARVVLLLRIVQIGRQQPAALLARAPCRQQQGRVVVQAQVVAQPVDHARVHRCASWDLGALRRQRSEQYLT